MKTLTKILSIVLMAIGIIVLAGCKKEESNNDYQSENPGVKPGSVWQGDGNRSFEYEGENVDVYLSTRIAFIGESTAEFRLEGLPEGGTINRRVGYSSNYLDFDGNRVYFKAADIYGRRMSVDLNSAVCPNCGPKTQALFDKYKNSITLQLRYAGDTIAF